MAAREHKERKTSAEHPESALHSFAAINLQIHDNARREFLKIQRRGAEMGRRRV
jgi:hypothetical protein